MNRNNFSEMVEAFMVAEMERLFDRVPGARQLTDAATPFIEKYYLRHRIETVKRIWLTSHTDALALAQMINEDYEAARWWSKYISQELSHDQLFIADLQKHGITIEQIAATEIFPSTKAMVEFIRRQIARIGSIAAVAYSVWVEWNSDKASAFVVERAIRHYSADHVRGSKAHVSIDINEDHYQIMLDVVYRLIERNGGDGTNFFAMLQQLTEFVVDYFEQLETVTQPVPNYSHQEAILL